MARFQTQQEGGKALRALRFARSERVVLGRSMAELGQLLTTYQPNFKRLVVKEGKLDRLHMPTRYPNGLPTGVPAEAYDQAGSEDDTAMASQSATVVGERLEISHEG